MARHVADFIYTPVALRLFAAAALDIGKMRDIDDADRHFEQVQCHGAIMRGAARGFQGAGCLILWKVGET